MARWVIIPETTPRRYISHIAALNLILPGDLTGDWHFNVHFVDEEGVARRTLPLAGEGSAHDTTPILGTHGVRDVTTIFARSRRGWPGPPVFAANHFRAIADLAFALSRSGGHMGLLDNGSLNQWLNTPADFAALDADYLAPFARPGTHADKDAFAAFTAWRASLHYTP